MYSSTVPSSHGPSQARTDFPIAEYVDAFLSTDLALGSCDNQSVATARESMDAALKRAVAVSATLAPTPVSRCSDQLRIATNRNRGRPRRLEEPGEC